MSDDNSSPTVSDPEESQDQTKTNEQKAAPLGATAPPKAKSGGTCFLVCFALLLIVVAALVVYFVTEGLSPGGSNHTTSIDVITPVSVDLDVTGSGNESEVTEFTTKGVGERGAFEDSDWPFESYVKLLGRPNASEDGACDYRMTNLSGPVVRIDSNLADTKKSALRTKKHHMLQLKATVPRSYFQDDKRVFFAIGLPKSAKKTAAVYVLDACNANAVPAGHLQNIDPHNPNVRRKIIRGLMEKTDALSRKTKCYFEHSSNDDAVVTLRTIVDLSYDSPGYTTPRVAVSSCNEVTRRCHRQFRLQASLPLTGAIETYVLYGVVPTGVAKGRMPTSEVDALNNEEVPAKVAVRTRCMQKTRTW